MPVPYTAILPLLLSAASLDTQASLQEDTRGAYAAEAKECVIRAKFLHEADLRFALDQAIEQWSEGLSMEPTLRVRCSDVDDIRALAAQSRVIHDDLEADISAERARLEKRRKTRDVVRNPETRYLDYLNLEEHTALVDSFRKDYKKYTKLFEIGKSSEGRPIRVLNITSHHHEKQRFHGKEVILLCGQHSRDWLAHAASMCVVENLLRSIDEDPAMFKLFDKVNLAVIPMSNPDGFVKTHDGERLWHKNAKGVDLNRNWNIDWGKNSGDDPSDDDFHGTKAFSEPETQAVSNFVSGKFSLAGFVDMQAFGSKFLYPYGYKKSIHSKNRKYRGLAKRMAAAMKGKGATPYDFTSLYKSQGATSGTSVDWVVEEFTATTGMTIRVRGESFVAPPSEIQPTCDEMTSALIVFLKEMINPGSDDSEEDKEEDSKDETPEPSEDSDDASDGDDKSPGDEDGETEDGETEDGESEDAETEDAETGDGGTGTGGGKEKDDEAGKESGSSTGGDPGAEEVPDEKKKGCAIAGTSQPQSMTLAALLLLMGGWLRRPRVRR